MLKADDVRALFVVDVNAGTLQWKSGRFAGLICSPRKSDGYVIVHINRRCYYVHRLIWLCAHGEWPTKNIDHINGNPSDNRIANLRDVTQAVNMQNRKANKRLKHGLMGVFKHAGCIRFSARIKVNGETTYLGRFETKEQAHAAYVEAKRRMHATGIF